MTNLFTMPCDESHQRDRTFASKFPLWCPGRKVTQAFSIDFTNVPNVNGDVVETVEILDSFGNPWVFEDAFDDTYVIADYGNGNSLQADALTLFSPVARAPGSGNLILRPKYPWHAPDWNRQYAWTIMLDAHMQDANLDFTIQSLKLGAGSIGTESARYFERTAGNGNTDAGHIVRMQISESNGTTIYTPSMSDLCSGQNEADWQGAMRIYDNPSTHSFTCRVLAVDPCQHELFAQTRVTVNPLTGAQTSVWLEGETIPDGELRNNQYDLRCSNWNDIDDGLYPSRLLGNYSKYNTFRFQFGFGSIGSPEIYLRHLRVFSHKLTEAEIAALCPLAP